MTRSRVYLAVPYTDPNPAVMEERFRVATRVAAEYTRLGYIAFSPITHGHPINQEGGLPSEYTFWQAWCEAFVAWAEELHVICLPGWDRSVGVQAEIALAYGRGTPIHYLTPFSN